MKSDTPKKVSVRISDRELIGVWDVLNGPVWGGSPEAMAAQKELWDVFGLDTRFSALESKATAKLSDFSAALRSYTLTPGAVGVLRRILSRPEQTRASAMLSMSALGRLPR